jgi:hypothetical protein
MIVQNLTELKKVRLSVKSVGDKDLVFIKDADRTH